MKRLVLAVPAVLILVVAGLIIGPSFIDWSQYRTQAQEQVRNLTGLELTLGGDIGLAILPSPRIAAEAVSVSAPAGSSKPNLLSLKKLNIHVALWPLLKGQIAVDRVSLVEPQINIERFKDGRMNWMTPQIEALMAVSGAAKAQTPAGDSKLAQAISFNKVTIDDGAFSYFDQAQNKETAISGLDLVLRAETLQGPYKFEGKVGFAPYEIMVQGGMGKYSADTKSIVPQVEATIMPGNIGIQYSGVISLGDKPEAQGETTVKLENLAAFLGAYGVKTTKGLDAPLTVKGLLTASAEKIAYKDLSASIGAQQFSGALSATMQPMNIEADFSAAQLINFDDFLPPANTKQKQAFSLDVLPKTLNVPADLEAKVSVRMPAANYRGHEYGNVTMAFGKKGKVFPFVLAAGELPGKGAAEIKGDLSFASVSKSEKTGGEILADPALGITITGKTDNLPFTLQSLTGSETDIAYADLWKTASVNINVGMKPGSISAQDSSFKLDDTAFTLSGSYTEPKAGARPEVKIGINTGALNWDALKTKLDAAKGQRQQQVAQNGFNPTSLAAALALPFDVIFDIGAQSVIASGLQAGGVAAKGEIRENKVALETLSVNDFAGASASLKGKVGDVKNLSGLDFTFSGKAGDIKKLASTLGIKADSIPAQMTQVEAQGEFKGNLETMAVVANVKAMGGELMAQGDVLTPVTAATVNALKLQVKHPNLSQAIKSFSPEFKGSPGLSRPLDFYTEVSRSGDVYTFNDMKGDLAGSPMTGNMSVITGGPKTVVNGNFKLGTLVIDAPVKSSSGSSPGQVSQGGAGGDVRWSREAIDASWMHKVNAEIGVTATSITYGAWPLQNPDLKITLKDGTLSLTQLNAGLYGGTMAISGKVQAGTDNRQPLNVDGAGSLKGVQMEQFVTAFAGNRIIQGKGETNVDFKIKSTGISPAAIVYDLAGNGTVTGSNIVIEGMDLTRFARALSEETKPGDTLLGLWKGSTKGGSTAFDTLDGAFTITEGVVNLDKMDLDGKQAKIITRGNVNLPRWTLATTHEITLYERTDIPPFKMAINGPLDNPGQTFAQGVLNDYIGRKVERKIQNLITEKLGLPSAQPAPAPAPTAQDDAAAAEQVAPSGGEELAPAPAAPQPQPAQQQQITPEEAIGGLLKNLLEQ